MAIEFSCSSCQKNYRVKDELAGKTADCTACGTKIRIPMLVSAASESDLNLNNISGNQISDLIDDELPTERSATLTPAVTTSCSECGAPIVLGAVVCVSCGYDKRLGDVLETESESKFEESEKRTVADHLKRGGAFSFLGAMLAAAFWFGLVVFLGIGVQVGYPAVAVGVLAGMGMKRFYRDGSGVLAGLVASTMSLAGVFVAKALIFDYFRRANENGDTIPEFIQTDNMFSLFPWYDVLFLLAAMAIAYAFTQNNESTEPEVV
ncbi:MAG: hypothetical protein GXP26_16425 [Planctomycetes bacterium]|nr:hypothetical protein [Planctomycetota bacterium]